MSASARPAEILKKIASSIERDILLINTPMTDGVEEDVRKALEDREDRQDGIFVILVTEGGSADAAYRIGMALQSHYEHIEICVAGWCKSAGTLIAICADELVMDVRGQLGPIDVQIAKRDELGDRDSGLVLAAALDSLADQSFAMFERFMMEIKKRSGGAVTFRTAADIASKLTIGVIGPIADKIDPVRMGADQRAQNVGRDYAIRLNLRPENLRSDGSLSMLLSGYSSHSFVIDIHEAERLFNDVKPLEGERALVIAVLSDIARHPGSHPIVGFVDDMLSGLETGDDDAEEDEDEIPDEAPDEGDEQGSADASDAGGSAPAGKLRGDIQLDP